jgi:mannitol-specific phosphotransferase system IIBC component
MLLAFLLNGKKKRLSEMRGVLIKSFSGEVSSIFFAYIILNKNPL